MTRIVVRNDNGSLTGPFKVTGTVVKENEVFVIFPNEGTLWAAPARSVLVYKNWLSFQLMTRRMIKAEKLAKQVAASNAEKQPAEPNEVRS